MNRDGTIEWNAGAWFGSHLGATLWMLIASGILVTHELWLGLTVLAIWCAVNGVCWKLWSSRASLPAYPCHQAMISLVCASCLIVVALVHGNGLWSTLQIGGKAPPWSMYLLLVVLWSGMTVLIHRRHVASRA